MKLANILSLLRMKNEISILKQCEDAVVVASVGTLKEAFRQWSHEHHAELAASQEEVLIDEKETLRRLRVSRSTLYRWDKVGYLVYRKRGGKNCYRLSDVERLEKGARD